MSASPEPATYQPLSQDPEASDDAVHDEENAAVRRVHAQEPLDSRVKWIHFVFGCAVLLPWNGACVPKALCLMIDENDANETQLDSLDYGYTILSDEVVRLGFGKLVQLVPVHHLLGRELLLPGSCDHHLEAGQYILTFLVVLYS